MKMVKTWLPSSCYNCSAVHPHLTRYDNSTSKLLNRGALALAIYGICVMVFCLTFNIYQLVRPPTTVTPGE